MFRKEANSFLHIHTLVLIGSLLPNFNRFLHGRGAGRRRGFHWSSSTCTGRSCIIATLFRFRFSIGQIQGRFMTDAASIKLNGSTSVPLPKKVTNKVKSSLVLVPARAIVRCCKASFLSAAALPSNSAASGKRQRD